MAAMRMLGVVLFGALVGLGTAVIGLVLRWPFLLVMIFAGVGCYAAMLIAEIVTWGKGASA